MFTSKNIDIDINSTLQASVEALRPIFLFQSIDLKKTKQLLFFMS